MTSEGIDAHVFTGLKPGFTTRLADEIDNVKLMANGYVIRQYCAVEDTFFWVFGSLRFEVLDLPDDPMQGKEKFKLDELEWYLKSYWWNMNRVLAATKYDIQRKREDLMLHNNNMLA